MGTANLHWYADRGFELDLDTSDDEVALTIERIPVPADGTVELRERPVELDRVQIMFKANVEVDGGPGMLQEATIRLVGSGSDTKLQVAAVIEDVETGEIVKFHESIAIDLDDSIPERGGPRHTGPEEDELDWEDETTLEQMVVNAPETTGSHKKPPAAGVQGLLKALADLPELDDADRPPTEELHPDLFPVKLVPAAAKEEVVPEPAPVEPAPPGDQSFSAEDEAAGLLKLLIRGESLELEEDAVVADLVNGVADIMALPVSSETKAEQLSGWLLTQDAVADLFINDEDLAQLLEQW